MSRIEDQIIRARERGDVTIDEIMRAVVESQDMTLAWHRMEEGSYGVLNHQYLVIGELIAAAIADAKREGAEAMREACADRVEGCDQETERWDYAEHIRAMPLPTGPRQAVLLTDEQLTAASGRTTPLTFVAEKTYRAIETAVLAANGLRNGNG